VVWRDSQQRPVAMMDRCSHRNAPLSEGLVCGDRIQCPYHGWTYDSNGNCVAIPSEGDKSFSAAGKQIDTFPALEKYGLIYVWVGIGEPDKEPFPMPYWKQPGWGAYYMYTEFENNVTNLVENFMDVPHTVFVHKSWFRSQKKIKVGMQIERTEDSVLVVYDQPNDSIGFAGWSLNPKKLPLTHTDKFYMPNVTRVDYEFGDCERAFVITSTCTPVSEYKSAVYTLISYKFGFLNPFMRIILPPYTRKVIDQDVWIMKLQGDNLKAFGHSNFRSTPVDTLHLFIESLRDWATSGGANGKPEPSKVHHEFRI
jgi:phenylpropionate dioxygenase-like ring-hydroxylating dioxygenase large terminal subunit